MTRYLLLLSSVCLLLSGLFASDGFAERFHSGGVGSCGGCHSMHGSDDGVPLIGSSGPSLLRGSDPSSLCLDCHSGAGAPTSPSIFSSDGSALTPGGDFYWMTKTFNWNGGSSPAARHGHNVVAMDHNLTADPNRTRSPGGNFPSAQLSCISCHDPHQGRDVGTSEGGTPVIGSGSYGATGGAGTAVGNFRLLGGSGYTVNGFSFAEDAPVARQNPFKPFSESDTSHVDYGSGMSEWCGNCHGGILRTEHKIGGSTLEHPAGNFEKLETDIAANYNAYVRTGDLSGTAATAYLQFVPFERGVTDVNLLDPNSTRGPDVNANVMCLTCHRAHASAFRYAGRWDFGASLLVNSHPGTGDVGATAADVRNSYYGRDIALEFGANQDSFCAKCHPNGLP